VLAPEKVASSRPDPTLLQCGEPFFETREVEEIQRALAALERANGSLCAPQDGPSIEGMRTLAELEKAVESLSPEDKQRLMVFLAARLRAENPRTPPPRKFTREEIEAWVKEDEEDARALEREG
jgi:hypothetical protein